MPVFDYKGLRLVSAGGMRLDNVLIFIAHGGFTPRRGLYPGSGTVKASLIVEFDAVDGGVGNAIRGIRALGGENVAVNQIVPIGTTLPNYSYTFNERLGAGVTSMFNPHRRDLMFVRPDGKAHLFDVFAACKASGVRYTSIRNFACRINKATYSGEISAPAP